MKTLIIRYFTFTDTTEYIEITEVSPCVTDIYVEWTPKNYDGAEFISFHVNYYYDGSAIATCIVNSTIVSENSTFSTQDCIIRLEHSTEYLIIVSAFNSLNEEVGSYAIETSSTLEGN